ncbi:MAG: hypothetical protein ACYCUM_06960 [Solirubrobacteraceae bacterium]
MTTADDKQITLTIEGERAQRGVNLSDFENFIESFLGALRDYDRARRGELTRKPGRLERRAQAVTAFSLVRFEPGSGIATIEVERLAEPEDEELPLDEVPVALENLRALADDLDRATELPRDVTSALQAACRAVGQDGSIRIDFPQSIRAEPARIDLPSLARFDGLSAPVEERTQSVSGRLHILDIEPDRLAIRTASGIDWTCAYPAELESKITQLIDSSVWAEGAGHMTGSQRGSMTIARIEPVEQGAQSPLFTDEPIADAMLLASQGIAGPQGLAQLADPEWDDATDSAYLAALSGD